MADLKCTDLCMTFANQQTGAKVEALKDINFTLKKGELLSVLGPSGCGKTTLLNMVAGIRKDPEAVALAAGRYGLMRMYQLQGRAATMAFANRCIETAEIAEDLQQQ